MSPTPTPRVRQTPSRPRRRRWGWGALALPALLGCASLRLLGPPALEAGSPLTWAPTRTAGPAAPVEVIVDDDGVPHLYGASEEDLAYGLGFAHARDRLMQVIVAQHAATGRLGELFGRDLVEGDRRLRVLTYRLEDEETALPARARALLESYVAGLNEGASHAGRGVEMRLLGAKLPTFTVRDVLAIGRLQAFRSATDFRAELARARIVARLPSGDPRRRALLRDVPAQGAAILDPRRSRPAPPSPSPSPPLTQVEDRSLRTSPERRRSRDREWGGSSQTLAPLLDDGGGVAGSSAWVVHGDRMQSGQPALVAEAHLPHRAPGAFYLVHLEGPGIDVTGATMPGVPAVVIGATPALAWTLTPSFADTQDLVELAPSSARRHHYLVDGEELPLRPSVQRFYAGGNLLLSETFLTSRFGPVLPPAFGSGAEPGVTYALLWSGFDPEATRAQLLGFWDLARAGDLHDADRALAQLATSYSVLLATHDGHIAYRLTGKLPRRLSAEPLDVPRDGSSLRAGWEGYVPYAELPASTDPEEGFLVAAGQPVLAAPAGASSPVGGCASTPHRALRVRARLEELFDGGKQEPAALLEVQQDAHSVEAMRLQPLLSAACPTALRDFEPREVQAFCEAVASFDGRYDDESRGALPFSLLLAAVQQYVLEVHLGADLAPQLADQPFIVMAIEEAILEEAAGTPSPLFDDLRTQPREGLGRFVAIAARDALALLHDEVGRDPSTWRWGRVHTLSFRGPLADTALIGGLFQTRPRPEDGCLRCVRAEAGLPIERGAALRLMAQPGSERGLGLITDFGQSGHVGDAHYGDLTARWSQGELLKLPSAPRAAQLRDLRRLRLLPRRSAEEAGQ